MRRKYALRLKFQIPMLPSQLVPEALVFFFLDQFEAALGVNSPRGVQDVVGL